MYKFILAVRYLFKRRITYLALTSVALCVFMVLVVMTVMARLARDFEAKNHNWAGDCILSSDSLVGFAYYDEFVKKLEGADFVEAVSAVIRSYGILAERSGWNSGVEIMGIDPERHSRVTNFGAGLYYHKDSSRAFEPGHDPNLPGCVVGIDRVRGRSERGQYYHEPNAPKYTFSISCFPLTAGGALAKGGLGLTNTKTFYYSDDSHSGIANVDSSFVYLPFEQAQLLCGMATGEKRASAVHIKFKPDVRVESGREMVAGLWARFVRDKAGGKRAGLLENVYVESYREYRREAMAAVEMEKTVMIFIFSLVGLITVFIILVVFYMIISHKSKDIGTLKSIGVADGDVMKLFLFFAFLVGVFGSAVGTAGGAVFLLKINRIEGWLYESFGFQLWNRMIYAIDDIPNKMEFTTVTVIIVSAIAACLVGAVIPSWQAARLKPIEALQVSRL